MAAQLFYKHSTLKKKKKKSSKVYEYVLFHLISAIKLISIVKMNEGYRKIIKKIKRQDYMKSAAKSLKKALQLNKSSPKNVSEQTVLYSF